MREFEWSKFQPRTCSGCKVWVRTSERGRTIVGQKKVHIRIQTILSDVHVFNTNDTLPHAQDYTLPQFPNK